MGGDLEVAGGEGKGDGAGVEVGEDGLVDAEVRVDDPHLRSRLTHHTFITHITHTLRTDTASAVIGSEPRREERYGREEGGGEEKGEAREEGRA